MTEDTTRQEGTPADTAVTDDGIRLRTRSRRRYILWRIDGIAGMSDEILYRTDHHDRAMKRLAAERSRSGASRYVLVDMARGVTLDSDGTPKILVDTGWKEA